MKLKAYGLTLAVLNAHFFKMRAKRIVSVHISDKAVEIIVEEEDDSSGSQ